MPAPASTQVSTSADVSETDLHDFFQSHFSDEAVSNFGHHFMNAAAASDAQHHGTTGSEWEEEDDLGYYDDGVKRTLTDEQIEIFRHSELEEMRREKERGGAATKTPKFEKAEHSQDDKSDRPTSATQTSRPKKRRNKKSGWEPKPDLRKRTWDVVEQGLDSLDYD